MGEMLHRMVLASVLLLASGSATAAGGGDLMDARADVTDKASLQRGAKLYSGYCSGCHSLKYMRYSRVAEDLDIPPKVVEKFLIWDGGSLQGKMTNAMGTADAKAWFGKAPPDLSLTARAKGSDWIYTYLNGYYRDSDLKTGFNNTVLKGSAMPHVLWQLQGIPEPVYAESHEGEGQGPVVGTEVPDDARGTMSEREYHGATRDITNFLTYVSEPIKATRERIGIWVVLFLLLFIGVAYMLKREYWSDLH